MSEPTILKPHRFPVSSPVDEPEGSDKWTNRDDARYRGNDLILDVNLYVEAKLRAEDVVILVGAYQAASQNALLRSEQGRKADRQRWEKEHHRLEELHYIWQRFMWSMFPETEW